MAAVGCGSAFEGGANGALFASEQATPAAACQAKRSRPVLDWAGARRAAASLSGGFGVWCSDAALQDLECIRHVQNARVAQQSSGAASA